MRKIYGIVGAVVIIAIVSIYMLQASPEVLATTEPPQRPQYEGISPEVFADLPSYPENFALMKRNFYDSQIRDFERIQDTYWKQPEWYPTWQKNTGWFTRHDFKRWGVHGYGTFPSQISYSVTNMSAGDTINIYTYLHTSYGIETWQGVKVRLIYNESLFSIRAEPEELLLEPTFPKFYHNWTQKLLLNVIAKQKIPRGEYKIQMAMDAPTEQASDEWVWDVLDKYTNNLYHEQIESCKKQLSEGCNSLLELRQNKYVVGGYFAPSNLFTATITAN